MLNVANIKIFVNKEKANYVKSILIKIGENNTLIGETTQSVVINGKCINKEGFPKEIVTEYIVEHLIDDSIYLVDKP